MLLVDDGGVGGGLNGASRGLYNEHCALRGLGRCLRSSACHSVDPVLHAPVYFN